MTAGLFPRDSLIGLIVALLAYAISVTPSLLPRRWWWNAAVSGTISAIGYLTGLALQILGGHLVKLLNLVVVVPTDVANWIKRIGIAMFLCWVMFSIVRSFRQRQASARLVEMTIPTVPSEILTFSVTFMIFLALLGLSEGFIWILLLITDVLGQWIPRMVAMVVSVIILVIILSLLTSRVLLHTAILVVSRKAEQLNNKTANGVFQPTIEQRSGCWNSESTWSSVGSKGREFLSLGPHREDIAVVTGDPSMEPIRVYAGMPTECSTIEDAAQQVVRELHRTNAFDRAAILLMTSTGSGWVDEWPVQSFEYLMGGNCATASMQYSYIPSALHTVTGLKVSVQASKALLQGVLAAFDEHPVDKRPALFVAGESLGAYAGQCAFDGIDDMLASVDGALWIGTPAFTPLHKVLTTNRDLGSPEVAPVIDSAQHVRFMNDPQDLDKDIFNHPFGKWEHPRVLYAQHPSDAVVWWDNRIFWHEPDWLRERAGRDVSQNMRFRRLVTWFQIFADLLMATHAPGGHGHTYHQELLPAFEKLLGFGEDGQSGIKAVPHRMLVTETVRRRIQQAISANIALAADN